MPILGASPARRVYASGAELDDYLGDEVDPAVAERLLTRASEAVDQALLTAAYHVDSDGLPVDSEVAAALRDATCAQVEFWLAGDEEDDILGPLQTVAVGGLQVQYGAGSNRTAPVDLAPRAARLLRLCPLIRF